jgi:hypothetical protein
MKRALAWIAVIGACGQPPAPDPIPRWHATTPKAARAALGTEMPRPPHFELAWLFPREPPWPLTEQPSVQPHLDVAMAHDACDAAFARRHAGEPPLRAYVAAWCKLRQGDRAAVDDLTQLASGADNEVTRAARLDVVNQLADYEAGPAALRKLQDAQLATPEMLDMLAATYAALGNHDDARAIGTMLLDHDRHVTPAQACERLIAWGDLDMPVRDRRLGDVADTPGDCGKRVHALRCAIDGSHSSRRAAIRNNLIAMRNCFADFSADEERDDMLAVLLVHLRWGDRATPANASRDLRPASSSAEGGAVAIAWLELGWQAAQVLGARTAEELAIVALEAAAQLCTPAVLDGLHATARQIASDPHHAPAFDARVAALRTAQCPDR